MTIRQRVIEPRSSGDMKDLPGTRRDPSASPAIILSEKRRKGKNREQPLGVRRVDCNLHYTGGRNSQHTSCTVGGGIPRHSCVMSPPGRRAPVRLLDRRVINRGRFTAA